MDNFKTFTNDFRKLLGHLDKTKKEVIIAGDFNINLLELHEKTAFEDFFNTMTQHSFYPKITLPTRFSRRRGTLIDNFYCKLSVSSLQSTAGVMLNKISDHLPYFICIDIIDKPKTGPKYISICKKKKTAATDMLQDLLSFNLTDELDTSPNADPSKNYDILDNKVKHQHKKHYPYKVVKLDKKKHKINKWMTDGILISIKQKNALYR